MRHWTLAPLLAGLIILLGACALLPTVAPTAAPATEVPPPAAPTEAPAPTEVAEVTEEAPTGPAVTDIAPILEALGGQPCEEAPDFTCVTINVPLDHFDESNPETLGVVFAVSPAAGERYGMFVQAFPGGPGGEGVSTAGLFGFSESILEHFDIVYFDQRGVGLSDPLDCPQAYAADFLSYLGEIDLIGAEGYDTPEEQDAQVDSSRTFIEACVAEMGVSPDRLQFYGTDQVAEDIESFREAIGDEQFWLYGVSYGTAVAQTYAAAYPERLAGLILDGTVDLTLTGEASAFSQEQAFDKVLVATLEACNEDPACAEDMGGDAVAAYDTLAAQVAEAPLTYSFPLPSGGTAERTLSFNALEYATAYQMYSLNGRMLFLRALAAATQRGDLVPLVRLLHSQALLDPESMAYIGDPTFSDTMFYGVHCTDNSYYSGTPEERIAQIIEAGQASNGTVPRLDGSVYTGLDCAFWPSAPQEAVQAEPLIAEGVPTFVLNATLDPATPFEEGKAVFERLADGYHLYVEGGRHSIYGFGDACPDDYITNFLVDGTLPEQREIVCEWDPAVIVPYVPLMPEDASAFADPLEALEAVDTEIYYLPEYFYDDFVEPVAVGCPFGGVFTFGPSDLGEEYTFTGCAFARGLVLDGTGSYDYEAGLFVLEVTVSGLQEGTLTYTRNDIDGTISVIGEYGGEAIDLSR